MEPRQLECREAPKSRGNVVVALVIFFPTAISVFLIVLMFSIFKTFTAPEVFASTARVHLKTRGNDADALILVASEVELLKSEAFLNGVVDDLRLNKAWAEKFQLEGSVGPSQSLELLRRMLEVQQITNTTLISIRVYDDDPAEAAKIAGVVAHAACSFPAARLDGARAEIVDPAAVVYRPVLPNKPLDIAQGIVIGGILACLAGGAAAVAAIVFRPKNAITDASPPPIRPA